MKLQTINSKDLIEISGNRDADWKEKLSSGCLYFAQHAFGCDQVRIQKIDHTNISVEQVKRISGSALVAFAYLLLLPLSLTLTAAGVALRKYSLTYTTDYTTLKTDHTTHTGCGLTILKKLFYELSLLYGHINIALGIYHPFDKIESNEITLPAIYLGRVPCQMNLSALLEENIDHIVSVIEPFENSSAQGLHENTHEGWFSSPICPKEWADNGITQTHLIARDILPLKLATIEEGVLDIYKAAEENRTIYVHCKAGRGRSTTLLVCYLIKYFRLSAENAYALVKNCRSIVHLNSAQWSRVKEYEHRHL